MTDADLIVLPGVKSTVTEYGRFWYTAKHEFLASLVAAGHGYAIATISVARRDAGPITDEDRAALRAVAAPLDWQDEPADVAEWTRKVVAARGMKVVPNYKLMHVLVPNAS